MRFVVTLTRGGGFAVLDRRNQGLVVQNVTRKEARARVRRLNANDASSALATVFDFRKRVVKPSRFILIYCNDTLDKEIAWHHSGAWYRCEGCGQMFKSGGWTE